MPLPRNYGSPATPSGPEPTANPAAADPTPSYSHIKPPPPPPPPPPPHAATWSAAATQLRAAAALADVPPARRPPLQQPDVPVLGEIYPGQRTFSELQAAALAANIPLLHPSIAAQYGDSYLLPLSPPITRASASPTRAPRTSPRRTRISSRIHQHFVAPPQPQLTATAQAAVSDNPTRWKAERLYESLLGQAERLGVSDQMIGQLGVSGGETVREKLRKLLGTVTYVLGRMTPTDGCFALSVLSAACRRALASPLHGVELTAEELGAIMNTAGGECLLEDVGFIKVEPSAPPEPVVIEQPEEPKGPTLKQEMPPGLNKFETSLWAAFDLADKNGDGALSKVEFTSALKAVGLVATDGEALYEWRKADLDQSGSVDFKEFLKLGKHKKALADLPSKLQANSNKVEAAASVIQARLRKAEKAGPEGGAAASGSGEDHGQFVKKKNKRTQPPGLSELELKLWRVFDALLDDDTEESLSRRELDGALWAARFKVGQTGTKQLAELFSAADRNKDGRIDWEEFKELGKNVKCLAELDPSDNYEMPPPVDDGPTELMFILPPLSGPEALAALRAIADLLEKCLDGWVHWSTEGEPLPNTDSTGDRIAPPVGTAPSAAPSNAPIAANVASVPQIPGTRPIPPAITMDMLPPHIRSLPPHHPHVTYWRDHLAALHGLTPHYTAAAAAAAHPHSPLLMPPGVNPHPTSPIVPVVPEAPLPVNPLLYPLHPYAAVPPYAAAVPPPVVQRAVREHVYGSGYDHGVRDVQAEVAPVVTQWENATNQARQLANREAVERQAAVREADAREAAAWEVARCEAMAREAAANRRRPRESRRRERRSRDSRR